MAKDLLADRIDHAIVAITMAHKNGTHQASWSTWMRSVGNVVPALVHDADLKVAFKRLWKEGIVRLSKTTQGRYHGFDYSGNDGADEAFFFIAAFNVTITEVGRGYWDEIKSNFGKNSFDS